MKEIVLSGRILFGICMAALGAENVAVAHAEDKVMSVFPWLPAQPMLVYVTGAFLFVVGLAIAARVHPRLASILLVIFLFVCELHVQWHRAAYEPLDLGVRTTGFAVMALCAAGLTLAGMFRDHHRPRKERSRAGGLLMAGRYLFAISVLAFGTAQFLVGTHVAKTLPAWLPLRVLWPYAAGIVFMAAGLSIALGWFDTLAATLLGVMFLTWFAALHLPHVIGSRQPYQVYEWSNMFIALGLCGASWIIATESLRRSHGHLAEA
jgi:uncharacterized membrane protein YphA (DoxX/SURF4 family)